MLLNIENTAEDKFYIENYKNKFGLQFCDCALDIIKLPINFRKSSAEMRIIMPRRGNNIYKRKDGRWEGRYQITRDGVKIYKSVYAKSYKEVKMKLEAKIEEIKKLGPIDLEKLEKYKRYEKLEVNKLFWEWIMYIQGEVKESTYSNYLFFIKAHMIPYWEGKFLKDFNNKTIGEFLDYKKKKGALMKIEELSHSSLKTMYYILNSTLKFAFNKDYIPPFNVPVLQMKMKKSETRIFYKSEQNKLEDYINGHISPKTAGILISLYTGVRNGELCALKWEDLDLENGILTVKGTLQRIQNNDFDRVARTKVIIASPKTHTSQRQIPIPSKIIKILKPLKSSCKKEDFVLTSRDDKYIEPRNYLRIYHRILKKCDIPELTFHACRHTFASRCIEIGIDPKTVSELLGHTSVNLTMNRYVHSSMELKKSVVEKLSQLQITASN